MRSFFYSKYFQTITKTPKEPYFNMTLWVFLNHWVKLKFLTHQNNLKRENLKFQRILFYYLSKEIGIGAQNGLLKKIPIFKISMDGHIRMNSMVLSKKIGASWIS